MKKHEQITKEVKGAFLELEKYADSAVERLSVILRGLSKENMIAAIIELHLSDKSLNFLCLGIALKADDHEICAAVQEIKKKLEALEIRQATNSPISYYRTNHELPSLYLHLASE